MEGCTTGHGSPTLHGCVLCNVPCDKQGTPRKVSAQGDHSQGRDGGNPDLSPGRQKRQVTTWNPHLRLSLTALPGQERPLEGGPWLARGKAQGLGTRDCCVLG